jgi:hypothetical protein
MNPNLLKLIALLGAGGMAAAPALMTGEREEEPQMLDSDSEEAQLLQAERQAERNYAASPARMDRLGAMSQQAVEPMEDEMGDEIGGMEDQDTQLKLKALNRLRSGI